MTDTETHTLTTHTRTHTHTHILSHTVTHTHQAHSHAHTPGTHAHTTHTHTTGLAPAHSVCPTTLTHTLQYTLVFLGEGLIPAKNTSRGFRKGRPGDTAEQSWPAGVAVVLGPALALGAAPRGLGSWYLPSHRLLWAASPSPLLPTQIPLSVCAETQRGPGNTGRESVSLMRKG